MDFVGCDDSTAEFGSTKSNKADQKIYLAKEFQHSLAPILSWNQWIILPNLLDLLLIFIEKKRWTISLWQEAIKRSWWTSDTWSSTQIGSQLKASRTTCHKMPQVFDHVSGSFSPVKKHGPTTKWTKITDFLQGKKTGPFPRAGFPITKDLMIEDNKKSQEFQVVRFQFLFESTLVSHEEKTTEIHLGETRFIRQNWPILGQCSLNLLLLEHLCQ